jgi:hypothetical protein
MHAIPAIGRWKQEHCTSWTAQAKVNQDPKIRSVWWHVPVVPVTQEMVGERLWSEANLGKVNRSPSLKKQTKQSKVWWAGFKW